MGYTEYSFFIGFKQVFRRTDGWTKQQCVEEIASPLPPPHYLPNMPLLFLKSALANTSPQQQAILISYFLGWWHVRFLVVKKDQLFLVCLSVHPIYTRYIPYRPALRRKT